MEPSLPNEAAKAVQAAIAAQNEAAAAAKRAEQVRRDTGAAANAAIDRLAEHVFASWPRPLVEGLVSRLARMLDWRIE